MTSNSNMLINKETILNTEIKNKGFALLDQMFKENSWHLVKNEMNYICDFLFIFGIVSIVPIWVTIDMFIFNLIPVVGLNGTAFVIVQSIALFAGAFVHAIFDIFFGAIQAYVYFMLFSIFMSMATKD